jgi:hypothetical protein
MEQVITKDIMELKQTPDSHDVFHLELTLTDPIFFNPFALTLKNAKLIFWRRVHLKCI